MGIVVKLKSRVLTIKNIDNIRSSLFLMKSMGKIKSQLNRCRGLNVVSKFTNIFKCQAMKTRLEEESVSHGKGIVKKAKRQ